MRKIVLILGLTITMLMMLGSPPLAKESTTALPEWLSRVYYGLEIKSDRKPRFYFQSVQPLWRSPEDDQAFFIQPYISVQGGRENYSIGLGYRQLLGERKYLIGTNAFFDYQDDYDHRQVGVGLEAQGKTLEARLNAYFGLSDAKLVEETATYREYEKVVNGIDAELGTSIPQLPWVKIFAGGFWYNAKYADNLEGWKTRLELKPTEWFTIDIGIQDDDQSETRWFLGLESRILFGAGVSLTKGSASHTQDSFDLTSRLLDPVERNFIPTLEIWQSDKTGTVTGRILDQNGDPVINAKVEIHSKVVTVYTDSNGEFRASVIVGNHILYAWNSNDNQIIDGLEIIATEGTVTYIPDQNIDDPSSNHASVVSDIPNQTIDEGDSFRLISLDDYVSDPDNTDAQITWSYSGNVELTVSISAARVATIATPNDDWEGSETITFTATDPDGLSDSDSATFTVGAVNDDPEISNLTASPSSISTYPGTSTITFDVSDVDGDTVSWTATLSGGSKPRGSLSPSSGTVSGGSGSVTITYSAPDNNGIFTITVNLDDGNGGSDSDSVDVTVNITNHSPEIKDLEADPETITGSPHESKITFEIEDEDGDRVDWTASISGDPKAIGWLTKSSGHVPHGSRDVDTNYHVFHSTIGYYTITITFNLEDGNGGTDSESVTIIVDLD